MPDRGAVDRHADVARDPELGGEIADVIVFRLGRTLHLGHVPAAGAVGFQHVDPHEYAVML